MPDIKHGEKNTASQLHGDARQLQNFSQGERRQKKNTLLLSNSCKPFWSPKVSERLRRSVCSVSGNDLPSHEHGYVLPQPRSQHPLSHGSFNSFLPRPALTHSLSLYPSRPVALFRLTPTPRASHEPALFILFGYLSVVKTNTVTRGHVRRTSERERETVGCVKKTPFED